MARSSVASITSSIATTTTATVIAIATATTTKINEATLKVQRRITAKGRTEMVSSIPTATAAWVWAMKEVQEVEEGEVTQAQAETVKISARNCRVVATPTIVDTIARMRRGYRCG